jgi:hypothetical protein
VAVLSVVRFAAGRIFIPILGGDLSPDRPNLCSIAGDEVDGIPGGDGIRSWDPFERSQLAVGDARPSAVGGSLVTTCSRHG